MACRSSRNPKNVNRGRKSGWGRFLLVARMSASGLLLAMILLAGSWVSAAMADSSASQDGYGIVADGGSGGSTESTDGTGQTDPVVTSGGSDTTGQDALVTSGADQGSSETGASPTGGTAVAGVQNSSAGASAPTGGSESQTSAAAGEYLVEQCSAPYWDPTDNYADYYNRLLSIDYSLTNTGPGTLVNPRITSATASDPSVYVATPTLPLVFDDLAAGEMLKFTLKWYVPVGVGSFKVDVKCDCDGYEENQFDDPDPDPDPDPNPVNPDPQDNSSDLNQPGGTGSSSDPAPSSQLQRSVLPNTGMNMNTAALALLALITGGILVMASSLVLKRQKDR